jgi:hypothetical protein
MTGPEGRRPHFEREPQHRTPTEPKPQLEGGNGVLGIPSTLNERAKPPPPESAANKLHIYLQESLGMNQPEGEEPDVDIFTTRALEGLYALRDTIDRRRPPNVSSLEILRRHHQDIPSSLVNQMELKSKQEKAYLRGLEDALKLIDAHLLGRQKEEEFEQADRDFRGTLYEDRLIFSPTC